MNNPYDFVSLQDAIDSADDASHDGSRNSVSRGASGGTSVKNNDKMKLKKSMLGNIIGVFKRRGRPPKKQKS